jgi:DNA-directed RNA polymerase subunit RPC12/RpoP
MLIINCPHCDSKILINKINCKIFRHGVYKDTFKQINPHLNKAKCDKLIKNDLIYGCGKPFELILNSELDNDESTYIAIKCDYK